MKFLIFLFTVISLMTCISPKDTTMTENIKYEYVSVVEDVYLENIKPEPVCELQLENHIEYGSVSMADVPPPYDDVQEEVMDESEISKVIIDTISSSDYDQGYISYNVPDTMKIGQSYRIALRSSRIYNEDMSIYNMNKVSSSTMVEKVRYSKYMSAKLIDSDEQFWIKELSTREQIIDSDVTEWLWAIKPLKSGSKSLRMVLTIRVENTDVHKDIPVFDKYIYVENSIFYKISEFFGNYWQWLFSTILIPIFVFLWKRKKNN